MCSLELPQILRMWCDLACVCHRWRDCMARQPIAVRVPTMKFAHFCRWAAAPGVRPPLCSIHTPWQPGLPLPFQRRRAQLARLLHSQTFHLRSGSTMEHLGSVAGADCDAVDPAIFPRLLSLRLDGLLPDEMPLPLLLKFITVRGSEATSNPAEELRLLLQERTPEGLPPLGPQLLQCSRLEYVSLTHFNVDGLAKLIPPSVQLIRLENCMASLQQTLSPADGWVARCLMKWAAELSPLNPSCRVGIGSTVFSRMEEESEEHCSEA